MARMVAVVRAFTAVALAAAFIVAQPGTCLCASRPGPGSDHGCCDQGSGLRAATPDCCVRAAPKPADPAAAAERRASISSPAATPETIAPPPTPLRAAPRAPLLSLPASPPLSVLRI